MSDYISRSALIAEIKKYSSHGLTEWSTLGVLAAIDRVPAADVREVVTCEKCRYAYKHRKNLYCGLFRDKWNTDYDRMVDDDEYCSHGAGITIERDES